MNFFRKRIFLFPLCFSVFFSVLLSNPIDNTSVSVANSTAETEVTYTVQITEEKTTLKNEKNSKEKIAKKNKLKESKNTTEKMTEEKKTTKEEKKKDNKKTNKKTTKQKTPVTEKETEVTTSIKHEEPETTQSPETTVYYDEESMLSSCGMTDEELESKLYSPLSDYSSHFIEAEKTYGVNAAFLAAVAALESGWGESYVAQEYNNLFGWGDGYGYTSFDSERECIMTVAKKLKENYLSPDGPYFNGYSIADINVCYNGSSHWLENVTGIYNNLIY